MLFQENLYVGALISYNRQRQDTNYGRLAVITWTDSISRFHFAWVNGDRNLSYEGIIKYWNAVNP